MLFFNRVEIYNGFSIREFSELKNALAMDGIKYDYKMIDRSNGGWRTTQNRSFLPNGVDPRNAVQYSLYVHHKDYERAMYLTSNRHLQLHA
jgi:hypothetical protein